MFSPLKIFYFYSNWKWTGPAEPALGLANHLAERGHEVHFFCGAPPQGDPPLLRERAEKTAVRVRRELLLPKHGYIPQMVQDIVQLRKLIQRERPDLLHVNLPYDHWICTVARGRVPMLRSVYDTTPFSYKLRTWVSMRAPRQLFWTIGEVWRQKLHQWHPATRGKTEVGEVPVDLERFSPSRPLPDMRKHWGIPKECVLFGLVARIQKKRRFDLLFQGVKELADRFPLFRLVLIGRGTHAEEVAWRAIRDLGLEKTVHLAGFLEGDSYVGALKALDVKLLMVPGSDQSARAVREAMAMGKPVLAGHVGVLPELLQKSQGGITFRLEKRHFVEQASQLIESPELREKMGEAARRYALLHFSFAQFAREMEKLYEKLLRRCSL